MKQPALLASACLLAAAGLAGCDRGKAKVWSVAGADAATVRKVAQGEIVGGLGRYDSHAWLGLPYAAPPVGDLRWRAPRPAVPWTGRREALAFAPPCPQYATPIGGVDAKPGSIVGDEDCLYLNVWAPRFLPTEVPGASHQLPVMLWIHGGGNSIGTSSLYDGGRLASEQNVIVISIQYRLGPLGWLSHRGLRDGQTDPAERSGNFGTLDIIQALRWAHDNVAAFGGDPGDVTVFGESAGGLDTYSMLLSPLAKGLFQRAIVESGTLSETTLDEAEHFTDDPSPGAENSSNEMLARALVSEGRARDRAEAKQKLIAMSDAEIGRELRQLSPRALLGAYAANPQLGMIPMPLVFGDGVVLPRPPWTERFAQRDGWNRVPVILGTNHDEMRLFLFLDPERVPKYFGFVPRLRDAPSYLATAEWASRAWKARAADEPAAAMRRGGATDVYVYRFDWHDEPTVYGADLSEMLGAAHGFEIPFVFGHFDLGRLAHKLFEGHRPGEAEALSSAMRAYWARFARLGNPGTGGRGDLPAWTAWDDSRPDAPRFIDLDLPSAGGIRMSSTAENVSAILAGIDQDPRLPTQRDKCRTYQILAGFMHTLAAADYPHAGKLGCEAYPLADPPWIKH